MTTILRAADGTRLAYRERGAGERLVVLPGGPMRASAYLGDLGGLTAHRRLVLPDLRGTGASQEPADPASYRADRQVADVEVLRAELGLERFDLLAHSAGGILALLYAAAHPERIGRLVLVTPNLSGVGLPATVGGRRRAAAARSAEPWYPAAMEAFGRAVADEASDADWDALAPLSYGRWDAAAQAHAAAEVAQSNEAAGEIYRDPAGLDPAAAKAALASLPAPVLLLAGGLDANPEPETAARAAAFFPRAEVAVQPGGGHFPWLDDARWFVSAVAAFLK
jgi:pimeloyl-ACP methyl ester carboxylesterase